MWTTTGFRCRAAVVAGVSVFVWLALIPPASASETLVVTGSGSTFVHPIMARWISGFARSHPNVEVNYQPLGSGRGVQDALSHLVDFGATDDPLTDQELAKAPDMLHVPIALGAVVVVYNLPGIAELRLSPEALARVFLGKISRWDDPVIARDNPGLHLPPAAIFVAHRADGSGTTAIFTRYLAKVSAEWTKGAGAGRAIQWPAGTGLRGNEGIAGVVSRGVGWIGYVELGYALQARLQIARLRIADGSYVAPSVSSIAAAAARAKVPDDLRISFADDGGGAWPMSGFTWALVSKEQRDLKRARVLVEFLWWCAHDGQVMAPDLGFAPLPAEVVERAAATLRSVRAGGSVVLSAG